MRRDLVWPILALFATTAHPNAQGASEETLVSRRVDLETRVTSQLSQRSPCRIVTGDTIQLGTTSMAVAHRGKLLLIAHAPGGKATNRVRSGRPHAWGKEARATLPSVTFHREEDGTWFVQGAAAVLFHVAGVSLNLIDMDLDGRFHIATDGYALDDSRVACPLQETLILRETRVDILELAADGTTMRVRTTPLEGSRSQLAALTRINDLRARHGLAPVRLDPELTRGCTEHANYLQENSWSGRTNPHGQRRGAKGATPAGARAAMRSVIIKAPAAGSIDKFWPTFYHRIGLMSPALDGVGINASPADIAVIDVARYYNGRRQKTWPWNEPACVPADGAAGVVTRATGEEPEEPVPHLGRRGMPLMAVFRDPTGVTDFAGTLHRFKKGRATRVPVLVSKRSTHTEAFGIIPEKELRSNAFYRAVLTWKRNGEARTRVIRFRTR